MFRWRPIDSKIDELNNIDIFVMRIISTSSTIVCLLTIWIILEGLQGMEWMVELRD